ncbi:hypothetical protein E4U30_002602 [Claviceps sp. LM220 group G6]|nr:hypothetical protein E4U30_002602 [Claviceps sp. LM220 group G6]
MAISAIMILFVIAINEFAYFTRKWSTLSGLTEPSKRQITLDCSTLWKKFQVAQLFLGDLYGQIIQFANDEDPQQRALTRLLDVQARSAATTQVLRHQLSHSKQSTPQSQPTSPTQQTSSQSQQTPNHIDNTNTGPLDSPLLNHGAITAFFLSRILEAQARPSVAHVHPVRINKPQNFNGRNQQKFRSWWATIMAYLESFPNNFDTDRMKISWVGSLLESSPTLPKIGTNIAAIAWKEIK